ncbi:hypothetical protein [Sinorhizobium sp. CCBAU 05631]|uniref:hypothetical protein n=1 Tax=Sinorhizobium sp. CCBAU 05631 TaxID=794846 RepID=UPI000BAC7BA4|nr:hypothetical protein [Sinorhizobium sp. CCBAU 05631]ASY61378.1 hypothetical protein SS05631_d64770 [Sinorhizobium sp. CCBAU 05631]
MDERFRKFADALHPKFEQLISMEPVVTGKLPKIVPTSGVYLFSENGHHLYVGRTGRMRGRYGDHSRPSASHNDAPFAFKLAREATGFLKSSYKAGPESRKGLSSNEVFNEAFAAAKARIRAMEFRFVEEGDPTAQCLLEIYASVVLETRYNDFENH